MMTSPVRVAYEYKLNHKQCAIGSHDDLLGGPCAHVSIGPGQWSVMVLPEDNGLEPMAFVAILAPEKTHQEDGYLAAEIHVTDVQHLVAMRDSLTAAIASLGHGVH